MKAWVQIVVFGVMAGIAGPLPAEPAAQPDVIERALRAGDYPRAEALARAQLADNERRYGAESRQALQSIDALVDALLDGERIETPDLGALIGREIALARTLAGSNSREYSRAVMRRANWQLAQFDIPASISSATESAAIADRMLAADDPERAERALAAGRDLYHSLGKPAEGEARVAAALDVLKRASARHPRACADALRINAGIQISNQNWDAAVLAARDYEAFVRETFGAGSARHGEALTTLGLALSESGQYAEGIETLDESVGILARTQPYRQRLHVDALRALGQRLGWMGDARGRTELLRALAIEERHPTGNGYQIATLAYALGIQSGREDDAQSAQAYLARAIPIYVRALGPDAPQTLRVKETYAGALLLLGRFDEAAAIYQQRIAAHAANPAAVAGKRVTMTYGNLAYARLLQRRYVEAEALYRKALLLLGEGHDFEQVNPRNFTTGLAAALWGQGRHRESFEQTRHVRDSAFRVRSKGVEQLSERELLNFDSSLQDASELTIAMAADSRDPSLIDDAWQATLETSGFVTRTMAARLALAASRHANAALWQQWRATNATLSAARVAATESPSARTIATLDRRQRELDDAERRIASVDSRESRLLHAEQGDLDAVFAQLPDHAALVRFVEISDYAPDQYRRGKPGVHARLYALARKHGQRTQAIDLGPVGAIAGQVDAWYALLSDARADPLETRSAARALRRALIDPLDLGNRTQRLFVVPSTALTRVNFAALIDEQDRYLVENGPTFHLLNHERELLLPDMDATAGGVLLAGAATAGAKAAPASGLGLVMRKACPGIGAGQLGALPGAASEIASLHKVAQGHAGRIDVLSGAAATETAVRDAMPGHSIVHLATHAFAFGDHCADGEALRSIALDLPQTDGKPADIENLSSLSALAFLPQPAGANANDGLLTSEEITTLNLSAADWVVLSACETALGKTQGGEGVFGLRRAFRLAGARTVVMSLWKVEDRATAQFMQALYQARLVDRLDTPAAMQAAMRATLAARRRNGESTHPLYWAGFVAAGAWH